MSDEWSFGGKEMNIGVVGSRSIAGQIPVSEAIVSCPWYSYSEDVTIVSGGADGVDSAAETFAKMNDLDTKIIEPEWDDWSNGHPAKARNTEIIEESDAVVAVWNGKSPGTRDSIDKALDRGVPIYVEIA